MAGAAKYKAWLEPDKLSQIRQWVKAGLNDTEIAGKMGIRKTLLSKWRRIHEPLRQALVRPMTTESGEVIDKHDAYASKPRKLSNVDRVQNIINTWMQKCEDADKPLTQTGLALALGIDKDTLYRYARSTDKRDAESIISPVDGKVHLLSVSDLIKRAMLAIEDDLNWRAISRNSAGAMFALKNWYGYADKRDVGVVQGTTGAAATRELTNAQLEDKIRLLLQKARD